MTGIVLAQGPAGGPPDPDAVRRAAEAVLSQPEYRVVEGTSLLDRAWQAIAEAIGRALLSVDADGGGGSTAAAVALVLIVLALAAGVAVALARLRRTGPVAAEGLEGPVGRPAADWAAEAEAHEQAARYREAVRCRYRQTIAELAVAGLVDEVPGRTSGEYRRAVALAVPAAAEAFGEMTERFDRAWYGAAAVPGRQAVDAAEVAAVRAAQDRVEAAVPRARLVLR